MATANPFESRTAEARRTMAAARLEALLVSSLPNILYLCGFSGSNGVLVIAPESLHLFTDSRYTLQAREEAPGARVHIERQALAAAGTLMRRMAGRDGLRAGFDPAHLSLVDWPPLKKAAGHRVRWKAAAGLVESLREIKSAGEMEILREAATLGSRVMAEVIEWIRPGVSELDVAAEIDYRMRQKGASGPSFDTIVASGTRTALPHAQPTLKRLQKRDLVLLDLGAILRHYCSDLTRTVCLGRAPARLRRLYQAVEDAQKAAFDALVAGRTAGAVDRAARGVLERKGLGRYFTHSTGHGLGIEIHEAPRIGRAQKQEFRVGNVVTIEPGVYIEGYGGIRIEDDVAVHASGPEILTSAPRGLLEL